MERILVCMKGRQGAWEALSHSVFLAKRIGAAIYVLRVLPARTGENPADRALEEAVRVRLERQIESAKAEGVRIDHFVAEGDFEEEAIRFAEHNRISLFVAEPCDGESRCPESEAQSLQKIRHRIACRVELVSPRRKSETTAARGSTE